MSRRSRALDDFATHLDDLATQSIELGLAPQRAYTLADAWRIAADEARLQARRGTWTSRWAQRRARAALWCRDAWQATVDAFLDSF